jgi:hypothetical protein
MYSTVRSGHRHHGWHPPRTWLTAVVTAAGAVLALTSLAQPGTASAESTVAGVPAASSTGLANNATTIAAKPYMGWSSWSLQSTNYPGVNPDGPASFISDANIRTQAKAIADKLKSFGYEYVNVDAGWALGADEYGRPTVNATRFPNGIKPLADYVHGLGLKFGIYLAVGLDPAAYRDGTTPILGDSNCHTSDLVYGDLRKTNGWDSAYKIDYSSPCAQTYADSIAQLLADWGVDFLKMDGVGPGSFVGGANHDNTDDVRAWNAALQKTGRPIQYVLSWALSHKQADVWKQNSNGWRVDTDVECYCNTIVTWNSSVKGRWYDVVQWIDDAGPGHWNNLDALDVGVGEMDGITNAERRSYATFWSIEAAPLFAGDDLTKLDDYGLSLLTNRAVIAIDQAGHPARPVDQRTDRQTWYAVNPDGSVTVAQFNLGSEPATVTTRWSDVGVNGQAKVRDVWAGKDLGSKSSLSTTLPAHGSALYTVRPNAASTRPTVATGLQATNVTATDASLRWQPAVVPGSTTPVQYRVTVDGREATRTASTHAVVSGLTAGSTHQFAVQAVVGPAKSDTSTPMTLTMPAAGGPNLYEAEAPSSVLEGGASRNGCGGCSGGGKVGNIGGTGNAFSFVGINAPADGTYLVKVAYTDGDVSRQGRFTVGDAAPVQVNFPGWGDNDWDTPQTATVLLDLKAGANRIRVDNPTGYIADIDAITL